jgi:hypothetical protein
VPVVLTMAAAILAGGIQTMCTSVNDRMRDMGHPTWQGAQCVEVIVLGGGETLCSDSSVFDLELMENATLS